MPPPVCLALEAAGQKACPGPPRCLSTLCQHVWFCRRRGRFEPAGRHVFPHYALHSHIVVKHAQMLMWQAAPDCCPNCSLVAMLANLRSFSCFESVKLRRAKSKAGSLRQLTKFELWIRFRRCRVRGRQPHLPQLWDGAAPEGWESHRPNQK